MFYRDKGRYKGQNQGGIFANTVLGAYVMGAKKISIVFSKYLWYNCLENGTYFHLGYSLQYRNQVESMVIEKVKNVIDSIDAFKAESDGTYNLETGKEVTYNLGFQVSFVRPEAFTQLNRQEWDDITNSLCQYLDSVAHIGVYCGEAEVSFHSTSLDKAKEVMERYNQESILDWAEKQGNPDSIESWFIINPHFNPKVVVDYAKVLDEIQ